MVKLDMLLFGYRILHVAKTDLLKLANIFLKAGINADIKGDESIFIREADVSKFIESAKGRIRYKIGDTLGFYGFLKNRRKRYGAFAAIVLAAILNFFMSDFVWDIRISGNEEIPDYLIREALAESGFEIGSRWSKIDKNDVEIAFLSENVDISWLAINRRGTVAYVEVFESKNIGLDTKDDTGFCNIVAGSDAVIEEITVSKGVAVVKVGDVVRRGDVLISGIVESDRGVYFCHAEGVVRGSESTCISVEIPREEALKSYKKEVLCNLTLNIFKFSINILKNYGNQADNCDIINETSEYVLFDKYRLPFSVSRTYRRQYTEEVVVRTDDEMAFLARERLNDKITSVFRDSDILKIRTYGRFDSSGYVMTSEIVYSTDIGKKSSIEIER